MSIEVQIEDEIRFSDDRSLHKLKSNGKVSSISNPDISVMDDCLVSVSSPDPIQLKIEKIMAKVALEKKMKTRSKNMSIFKWLLRFFACFFLTLRFSCSYLMLVSQTCFSVLLLLLLTFVFSQDQSQDLTDNTPSLTSVKPTIFINTKFKVPASVRAEDLMMLL